MSAKQFLVQQETSWVRSPKLESLSAKNQILIKGWNWNWGMVPDSNLRDGAWFEGIKPHEYKVSDMHTLVDSY